MALCSKRAFATVVLWLALITLPGAQTPGNTSASETTLALHTGKMLAVIGVSQEEEGQLRGSDRKSLENRRIGFGLTTLLAEVLYDTGKFSLLEEKEMHKRELLDNLVQAYWLESGARYSAHQLQSIASQLGVELLAYGSVSHTRRTKRSQSFGPFSHHEQKLQVKVNVCLYEALAGNILCREGQGEAQQEGTGVFYEFQGDRLDFDKNAAGKATKQAVMVAVKDLVAKIRFAP